MLELFFIFIRQPDDDFPQWRGKLSEKNKKKKMFRVENVIG